MYVTWGNRLKKWKLSTKITEDFSIYLVQSNSVLTNSMGPCKYVHDREIGITVNIYVIKLAFGTKKRWVKLFVITMIVITEFDCTSNSWWQKDCTLFFTDPVIEFVTTFATTFVTFFVAVPDTNLGTTLRTTTSFRNFNFDHPVSVILSYLLVDPLFIL